MTQRTKFLQFRINLLPPTLFLLTALAAQGQNPSSVAKRPITVRDAVGMTRLEIPDYLALSSDQVAHFSPDGKRFVLVLRKGNLEQDTNDFSVLLYQTADALHAPKPDVLLRMSSSSNRDGVSQIRWLADNDTLVFLGENPGELPQIYSFNVTAGRLKRLTSQPTAIIRYDITRDGRTIAFMAEPSPTKVVDPEQEPSREIVVEGQDIDRILAGDYSLPEGQRIFWQLERSTPHPIRLEPGYFPSRWGPVSLSPDGRYVLFSAALGSDQFQPEWASYGDLRLQQIISAKIPKHVPSFLQEYLLFDSQNVISAPLINAPIIGGYTASWGGDSKSVLLSSYLPLDVEDPTEKKARKQTEYSVEVKVPSREYRKVTKEEVQVRPKQASPIGVTLEQDVNTPPRVYVTGLTSEQKVQLLDLNPQFGELEFGRVETIEWEVRGARIIGGLYLPPDYKPGKRYPLVIQTHGFMPREFSMDGLSEWSSAYAARPLAARGIMVLQAQNFKDYQKDHDRIGDDRSLGATVYESFKNFSALLYEGAIDSLDNEGMIDRNRVGIVGFSRTVCFVGYTLTHSKFRFAAASLVDGIGCGYLDEMMLPTVAWDFDGLNGGVAPFGEGLKLWMKNSPGFNLDKVHAPIRLVALNKYSVLGGLWEWYAGLSLQRKPVDFVLIPGATHLVVKPREREFAQQGLVDWFTFWLKGEEDPHPAKAEQYARWRELHKNQAPISSPLNQ